MANLRDILAMAASQIGTKEQPADSNCVKYNTAYYGREISGNSYPWCCAFQWWLFKTCGASNLFYGGGKTASCTTLYNYHRAQGQAVSGNYQLGDLVFFDFSGRHSTSNLVHIGIVEGIRADGRLITIEGNTGSGNDTNGGAVMRRTRDLLYVAAGMRPAYAEKEMIDMTKVEVEQLIATGVAAALEQQRQPQYQMLSEVPEIYRPALQKLMDTKALGGYDGGRDGAIATIADNTIRVDETFCRIVTVLDRLGLIH